MLIIKVMGSDGDGDDGNPNAGMFLFGDDNDNDDNNDENYWWLPVFLLFASPLTNHLIIFLSHHYNWKCHNNSFQLKMPH